MSSQTQLARLSPPNGEPARVKPATKPAIRLDKRQKAAIIVRFLLNEGADVAISQLPESQQAELTYQIGRMGYVDRDTLGAVLMEFAHELETIGLSFPGGMSEALASLEGRLSPEMAARLRKEAGVGANDPWDRIRGLECSELVDLIDAESYEVAAVTISKLDVGKAAELLSMLPGEKARRITYAVSMTGGITPAAVARIGQTLAMQLDDVPPRAFDDPPVDRVGAILNSSTAATRDDLLTALEETDEGFASQVKKTIFTYAHISERVEARDVPRFVKDIEENTLVTALTYATEGDAGATSEFILASISARLADGIRELIEERGKVTSKDGEAALSQITAVVRDLADQGEFTLIIQTEPED
ncbi:flagellar motor switch protein FliG [Shimia abyssi]|uniref:Flagellar motor switch protein FliG n=1 Tax=Shimia abyssi TaxID=1662395 RepID=A0A2P8FIW4_9RHOB|nr:FliG C-terminal domain-containing protein [Shimia abyssi]PSL21662.1 flagellar motor switch protein FliG [Shimia abyssi]